MCAGYWAFPVASLGPAVVSRIVSEPGVTTMNTLITAAIRCCFMFLVTASLFFVAPAKAYTVTLQQVGTNVVATGSGAINLAGLPINPITVSTSSILDARRGDITTGPTNVSVVDVYAAVLTGPSNFGSGSEFFPDAGSGDLVGISIDQGLLFVPHGYVSNAALSDSMTFNNATFASLFVTPGTYVWTWGTEANQNFTLQIGSVGVGVSDGGTTVSLLGCALLGLAALRRKAALAKGEEVMKTLPKKFLPLALFAIAVTSLFSVRPVQAYTVTLEQVGSNVVATGSGAFDLTGLTFEQNFFNAPPQIQANFSLMITGPGGANQSQYVGFTGPTNFGSGDLVLADSGSGDGVGIFGTSIIVPQGYVSGAALSEQRDL